ncbi:DNA/RNA non-specific endonuclease [Thalassoroseus pseudoceratinae]|uniref:DNA/RNA non-specific endonuclease n=1 Tax=Thalassoroseus pseudoceratinae TaxID=2713176 RepID=UPI0014225ED7|nr:DNA/RNA non-specific endonuclease [Thalassoroseus pseudoceratinae]
MIHSIEELASQIGIASQRRDLERLEELEKCFRATREPGPLPLAPDIQLNSELVDVEKVAVESDRVLGLANALSRAKRRIVYHQQKWTNFRRPVIVSEGDSWFQYPVRLDDVIDVLLKDHLILSLGAAGDLLTNMAAEGEYLNAIENEEADVFLLSGGGNDMLHSGRLAGYLKPYRDGMDAQALLQRSRWNEFREELRSTYAGIFHAVATRFSSVVTFCHGYDYAIPRVDGKWLGGPLASRGVPKELWPDVIKILIDEFNDTQKTLAAASSGRVVHVDCRGTVGKSLNSWFDELHPKDTGYKKVAQLFAQRIADHFGKDSSFDESMAAEYPTHEVAATISVPVFSSTTASLPLAVTNQFVARSRPIGMPSHVHAYEQSNGGLVDEAIIDSGRSKVGPMLPPAPISVPSDISRKDIPSDTLHANPEADTPYRTCAIVRAVRDNVLERCCMPYSGIGSEVVTSDSRTDDQLRKLPPCTSLAVWQAHLRKDPQTLRSYNDFVEVRRQYEQEEPNSRVQTRLELLPESDLFFQERIIGRSNLEQINFLSRGERAARTVGRMSIFTEYGIPAGTGSGFLVGPGLLLTNNHVIGTQDRACSGSYILFDYEYDADNRLKTSERFDLTDDLFLTDKELDFTFVSVASVGSRGTKIDDYGRMRLVRESGKALKGEEVSIIQHPEGLPKQIAIRESTVVGRKDAFIYYYADTNRGSSGSPVVNDQWFPVALHHRSVPDYYNTCEYVANRGIRVSEIYKRLEQAADAGSETSARIIDRLETEPSPSNVPVTISSDGVGAAVERFVEPFHELPYDNREGYDDEFLGRRIRMPLVTDAASIAAPRTDTTSPKYLLTYEHFSVVMHKQRRLAIFTAANVDASPTAKRPELGKNYSRKGLGGLGRNDRERWFEDPRISSSHQLPDRFFENDGTAFDKGHLTMRADVGWGSDYDEVRRANGDTFHTTNCSPQVAKFNRAIFGFHGLWGELEEVVLEQAEDEKLCVFSGPILADADELFRGLDSSGEVLIQIPAAYWKVIVARNGNGIESFAFILEQDLSDVPLEFDLPSIWKTRRVKVADVEARAGLFKFPDEVRDNDGG